MAITKVTTGTIADDSIQSLKNRNLIINGAMNLAQRATQVTGVTSSNYRTCDRFRIAVSMGTWTVDQSTDSPNGFSNSLKLTCTTADASPAASGALLIQHRLEAQNLQHLAFGTADAKSMTFSFWVKSNKTGSASFVIIQDDNSDKMFSSTYTISSADTWEYKTISIPADTSGVINNDNGQGVQLDFWLNSGSNYTGGGVTSGWETFDNTKRNPSNLGVGGAVNDYFAITGIQLEVGDVATPFEHESYGETLAKCKRYYHSSVADSDGSYSDSTHPIKLYHTYTTNTHWEWASCNLPVTMRSAPSITTYDANANSGKITHYTSGGGGKSNNQSPYSVYSSKGTVNVTEYGVSGIYGFTCHIVADAEL